jgi:hypothetical protein
MLAVAREPVQAAVARAATTREASAVAYDPAPQFHDQLAASGQSDIADTGRSLVVAALAER